MYVSVCMGKTLVRVTAQLKDAEQAALSSASRIAQLQSTTSAQQEQLRGAAAEIERGNQVIGDASWRCTGHRA